MKLGESFKLKAPVSLEDLQEAVQNAEVSTPVKTEPIVPSSIFPESMPLT